jgi:hypothetical protein
MSTVTDAPALAEAPAPAPAPTFAEIAQAQLEAKLAAEREAKSEKTSPYVLAPGAEWVRVPATGGHVAVCNYVRPAGKRAGSQPGMPELVVAYTDDRGFGRHVPYLAFEALNA